jgi:large subunit ribosomal protein LP1
MAHVQVSALSKAQKDELVCTYAALLLNDGELEITEEKLNKVISASGNSVEGYWPGLFAKALKGRDINDLISNAAAAAPVAAAPVAAGKAAPAETKKEAVSKYRLLLSSLRLDFKLLSLASHLNII